MDLLSCRNLLIYFEADLQKKIIPLFHYSLKPEGYLFLGTSETIGDFGELFETIDAKWRIYRRKAIPFQPHPLFDTQAAAAVRLNEMQVEQQEASLYQFIEKNLMDTFVPACVVINKQGTILYFFGKTGKYLEPPSGKAQLNLFKMVREELQTHLPAAIHRVLADQEEAIYENLKVRTNGDYQYINLHIRSLGTGEAKASLVLVIFEELKHPPEQRQYYEELKSANEELETSREEMQSLNEELSTVNTELQVKIKDLDNLRQDMNNYLNSLEIPVVILDTELKIKHFSTRAMDIINLINSDIGRPINHIVNNLKEPNLMDEIINTRDKSLFIAKHVETRTGTAYIMRIMPYLDNEDNMAGIVLSFLNVKIFNDVMQHLPCPAAAANTG